MGIVRLVERSESHLVSTAHARSALELIAQPVQVVRRDALAGNRSQEREAVRPVDSQMGSSCQKPDQ